MLKKLWRKAGIKHQIIATFLALIAVIITMYLVGIYTLLPQFYVIRRETAIKEVIEIAESNTFRFTDHAFLVSFQKECSSRDLTFRMFDSEMRTLLAFTEGTELEGAADRLKVYAESGREDLCFFRLEDINTGAMTMEAMTHLGNGRYAVVSTGMHAMEDTVEQSALFIVSIIVITMPFAVLLLIWMADLIAHPMQRLCEHMTRFPQEKPPALEMGGASREIGEVQERFIQMQDQIDRMMRELRTKNDCLEETIRIKDRLEDSRKQFFSSASHELKTPIAVIQGYSDLMQDTYDVEELHQYARALEGQAFRMKNLVRQLLDVLRSENSDRAMVKTRVDLVSLIDEVCDPVIDTIGKKNVRLVNEPVEKDVYDVLSSQSHLEHILSNYITNAADYVVEGGLIRIGIEEYSQTKWRLSVFNTGRSIPEEHLESLWDQFYRADASRSRQFGGTGLGLSIAKASAEAIGEKYGVENVEDGVIFYITLDKYLDQNPAVLS